MKHHTADNEGDVFEGARGVMAASCEGGNKEGFDMPSEAIPSIKRL